MAFKIPKVLLHLLVSLTILSGCESQQVNLQQGIEQDIIIINIEKRNRAALAELIQAVDSCRPAVIALNVFFQEVSGDYGDELLQSALKKAKNDILVYAISSSSGLVSDSTNPFFTAYASSYCRTGYRGKNKLIKGMTPIEMINGRPHTLFPLQIIELWRPGFRHSIGMNETILINYTMGREQVFTLSGNDLIDGNMSTDLLKGKIVILGYAGPGNEDKHYTPLRTLQNIPETEPDSYGSLVLANAIRTILEYEIK